MKTMLYFILSMDVSTWACPTFPPCDTEISDTPRWQLHRPLHTSAQFTERQSWTTGDSVLWYIDRCYSTKYYYSLYQILFIVKNVKKKTFLCSAFSWYFWALLCINFTVDLVRMSSGIPCEQLCTEWGGWKIPCYSGVGAGW